MQKIKQQRFEEVRESLVINLERTRVRDFHSFFIERITVCGVV